jgi:SH3-like domain-containing protein
MFFYREIIENIIKNWKEKQILSGTLATDLTDNFGYSVAMNSAGDRVIVGAWQDERSGGSGSSGLAYIYVSGTGGWNEQIVLSGSFAIDLNDNFGNSVAMNSAGDRVVIGARLDELGPASITQGLAYVFVSGAGGWSQQLIPTGTFATTSDQFGSAVAMNSVGDRIIVGAQLDERSGGQISEGLAYIYVSGASGWVEQHILSGTLAVNSTDQFGNSVAMNSAGDRVIVGAGQDERSGGPLSEGLAYIFVSGTGGWTQQHVLSGTLATSSNEQFGNSVAMNSAGDRVVVGAYLDERVSQATNYNEGLAYVFVSGTGGWSQQPIISGTFANNTDDWFGWSVAMNSAGDRIIVGARLDEITGSGGVGSSGLAYIFVSGTTGWTQQQPILSGSLATNDDQFGYSVAMNSAGDRVIVGAWRDEKSTSGNESGLAYVFNEE